jgi:PAS domain S-box-containing protein
VDFFLINDTLRMKPAFNKLLKNYEKSDFVLQQKVKVLLTICLSILGLVQIVIICAVFLFKNTAMEILLPQVIAFVFFFGALCLLVKGYFLIAAHLILITGLTAAWMVMFFDPTGAITRLDTIAYVLAALTMTPLIVNEAKWPIIVYFLVNFVVLTVFIIFAGNQLNFTDTHSIDYWLDNSMAILFIGIISYKVFSINRKALDQAAQDIKERKNAEKASATAKTFLESSLSSIPEGILLLDEDICLSYVNPVFLEWVGRSREELIGKPLDALTVLFLEPRSARQINENDVQRVLSGESIIGEEIEILDEQGRYMPIAMTAAGILNEDRQIIGIVVILVDLTERRQLETRLRQSQKMEAIGTLAGGIAHDFNNILSAIMGNTELLLYQNNLHEAGKKKLDNIYIASQRAKDLVGQILLFSRKGEQECKPVALKLIVKEILKLIKASLPSTIEIKLSISDESIQVLADPTQIHQILMNLCTNAHHAMMYAGGVLTLELSTLDIVSGKSSNPSGLRPGAWVKLCVRDTGKGMSPEIQERIFEPYFSTREKGLGTGLGLAVVHGIVQTYGGRIDVYSQQGEGTTFTVFLPRLDQLIEKKSRSSEPMPMGNKERILFVDDEVMLIDVQKDALESLKYQVVAVSSADQALKLFSSSPDDFDLVITDMTMPKMTGDVLAREILKIRPDIPVILCTGFSETITKEKVLAAGIRDFMMKPVKIRDLAESVHNVLAG